ncbi:MAG TPA: glycosyltransferase [Vicinamibacterales bacterium]|nr:glycosyltransferase [Vicinamibacterales bacterium]
MSPTSPLITVIVCTWNRCGSLRNALASLTSLRTVPGGGFEILVIDDGSVDATRDIVRTLAAGAAVDLRYVWQPNQGIAAARNRGVAEARGEWVAFFDDDQVAEPQWLAELFTAAVDCRADAVGGPCVLDLPDGAVADLPRTIRRLLGENPVMLEPLSTGVSRLDPRRRQNALPGTGNALIRKTLLAALGGFAPDRRYGEDLQFFRRAQVSGARFAIASRAVVRHVIPAARLSSAYLLAVADKGGRSQGEIDAELAGPGTVVARLVLRVVHLVAWTLPGLAVHRLRRQPVHVLSKRCSARVARSYVAGVASAMIRKKRLGDPTDAGVSTRGAGAIARTTALARAFLNGRVGGVVALADQGVISVTNFVTALLIGRLAGKSELGLYAVCWTLILLSTELSTALIATPYTVFSPQMSAGERRVYRGSMLVQQGAVSIGLGLLVLLGAAVCAHAHASGSLVAVVVVTASVLPFIGIREFARRMHFADLQVGSALWLDAGASGAQLAMIALLCASHHLSAIAVYGVMGAASGTVSCIWLVRMRSSIHVTYPALGIAIRRNWQFARWVLASAAIWACAMYLYPWVLTAFHGAAATGVWAACAAIVAVGNPVLIGLGNYVGPSIANTYAHRGSRALRRHVYRASLGFGGLLLPLAIALAIVGGRVVGVLYGAEFSGHGLAVALLAVNLLLMAAAFPLSRGLFMIGGARADALVNLAAVGVLFTFGLEAVRAYGVPGAAFALCLSSAATLVVRIVVFDRMVRRRRTREGISGHAGYQPAAAEFSTSASRA